MADREIQPESTKAKYPEIIEAINNMDAEERFEYWLEPEAKQPEGLTPATIEIHDKKITAVPKWGDDSTGEEVLNWWIK